MPTVRDFLEKINIRADIAWNPSMAAHTTFHIGGPADVLVRPLDRDSALRLFLAARAKGIPLFILGGGANILVGDRGFRGIVLDTGELKEERAQEGRILVAEAGLSVEELCLDALALGLSGLEDFAGMPGSVGGAVYMNARCYDREIADSLLWVDILTSGGTVERRYRDEAEWSYKRSPFQEGGAAEGALILAAAFRLSPGETPDIAAVMRSRRADREAKGHYRLPCAGSVFKNDRRFGKPTGKILDELGFRGRRIGGAMVSDFHANIFVNSGGATAAEMRALVELARGEARSRLGMELESELIMVGDF